MSAAPQADLFINPPGSGRKTSAKRQRNSDISTKPCPTASERKRIRFASAKHRENDLCCVVADSGAGCRVMCAAQYLNSCRIYFYLIMQPRDGFLAQVWPCGRIVNFHRCVQ